jgi:hypothetical protein
MIFEAIVARRVSALSDSAINVLLDAYLFGHSPLCLGPSANDGTGIWRCQWCQAVDDRAIASRIFDGAFGHYREASIYTMEAIVAQLQCCDKSAQITYMFSLRSQILGDTTQTIRRDPLAEYTQLMIHHSWRRVAVAALTAIGVVDEQGFVREG